MPPVPPAGPHASPMFISQTKRERSRSQPPDQQRNRPPDGALRAVLPMTKTKVLAAPNPYGFRMSFSSFPARNTGSRLGGTATESPVLGLRPL